MFYLIEDTRHKWFGRLKMYLKTVSLLQQRDVYYSTIANILATKVNSKRANPSAAWVLYFWMMANRAVCRGHVGRPFLPRDVDVAGCLKSDWRISR